MRVVTYARVSTDRQGDRGSSLVSQSQKFTRWRERGGHEIVRSYEERQSATSVVKRRLFTTMLAELETTQPEMIVVDSADRFSRNLEDVFDVMKRLRERGINIWPLEWERDDPPNIIEYDSADYIRFRDEVIAAQAEAKRIRTRVRRSYAARRERGVTTTTAPPFGVKREDGRLVPDEQAWIIAEADARVIAGERLSEVVRWTAAHGAWSTIPGLRYALASETYVALGIRSAETHAAVQAALARIGLRHGNRRRFEHEFTGVFACGVCIDNGIPEEQALLSGFMACRRGGTLAPSLGCQSSGTSRPRRHSTLTYTVARVAPAWREFVAGLTVDEEALRRWASGQDGDATNRRREIERTLAAIDGEEAALERRRRRAFDLLGDEEPAIVAQARKALIELDRDERTLSARGDMARSELAQIAVPRRDVEDLRAGLRRYLDEYEGWSTTDRNAANRLLCGAVGSHPRVYRDASHAWAAVRIVWPEVRAEEFVGPTLADLRPHRMQ